MSWAPWLLFTGVLVLCVVWCVWCPGPLGSCSPVCLRGVCCVACAVSWASWLLFTGVLCVVRDVLGHLASVLLCACSACCVVCVAWVLVCARLCHTVLVAFFVAPKSRRRCAPPRLLCALMTYATCAPCYGLFVFGNAQE